jgi:hypothetical protein
MIWFCVLRMLRLYFGGGGVFAFGSFARSLVTAEHIRTHVGNIQ